MNSILMNNLCSCLPSMNHVVILINVIVDTTLIFVYFIKKNYCLYSKQFSELNFTI